jgi:hypothetical protein
MCGRNLNTSVPINNSYNDVYYSLSPDSKSGLMSSTGSAPSILDELQEACCYDIQC